VICELLGVPVSDQELFRSWTAALLDHRQEVILTASDQLASYFTELITAKRANPGGDLLSALTAANADGDRLNTDELLATLFLLLAAGHETTVNLIGNGVHALAQRPDIWRELRESPDLLPGAGEFRSAGRSDLALSRGSPAGAAHAAGNDRMAGRARCCRAAGVAFHGASDALRRRTQSGPMR